VLLEQPLGAVHIPGLAQALEQAIGNAGLVRSILSLDEYYAFLDNMAVWVPTDRDLLPKMFECYHIVDQAPEDRLNQGEQFNQWLTRFAPG
jgi:hypothetical protein